MKLLFNIEVDITKENEILKDLLIKNGRKEFQQHIKTNEFESLFVYTPSNKKEAFFVIDIQFLNKNIYEITEAIEKYSYDFFIELSNTHVDINNFVLSYFIKIDTKTNSRNYFIRASRNEIDELNKKLLGKKDFIDQLKNKVVDELFRNI
ncbi:MAG: hypothetical protein I8H68_04120 [Flavobacteriia bacterium]|nr:hypothetical protein [Flavobacteriia bacterium]